MTEAFTDAVDILNVLADSMDEMEEDEARLVGMLVCDLAAYLSMRDRDVVWHLVPAPVRLQ
jgi:hypothetical protein